MISPSETDFPRGLRSDPHSRDRRQTGHFSSPLRWYLTFFVVLLLVLASVYFFVQDSEYRGSQDLHVAMEMVGAVIGLLAGLGFMVRFYALGQRFQLLVGLAFFVNGAEDFVHGYLPLAISRQWIELPDTVLEVAIPVTYTSGRMMMAMLLVLAPLLPRWRGQPRSPKVETVVVSAVVLLAAAVGTAWAFQIPLPYFAFSRWPGIPIARPLDFVSAILFALALGIYLWEYRRTLEPMTAWLVLSIGVNMIGQVTMSFSDQFYDSFFDAAQLCKILGYSIPILGLSLYQTASISELHRAEQNLRAAHDELEIRVEQRTRELAQANQELTREVAQRQRAQEVLRESEALYSSLVENLPVHVLRKNREGHFAFANRSFCDLIGKPLDAIVGKTDFDLYPEEMARKFREDDRRVMQSGTLLHAVEENRTGSGPRYVEVMKSPLRDAAGQIVGVQIVFWDVTERKRVEAALEQERYLLHSLMDHLPHNIYFKDSNSRFIRVNKGLAGYFGLHEAGDVIGKTDFDFFTEEHARQAMEDELAIMRSGQPIVDKEEKETWPDGHTTWALTTKMPLWNEEGQIVGTFGLSRDITEQRQAAEALRAAKEAAEAANEAKSAFLANMSHEIRTPMNAIIGMTELVLDTPLTDTQQEYLSLVRDSAESLLEIINDILDFSKVEAGKLDLDLRPFDLRECLGDTMKSLALRAHAKGLELALHIRPEVPARLVGDAGRLRQIVVNLVGNAIKFTESGEVVVEVSRQAGQGEGALLHFAVADTGIGIPRDVLDRIFQAFEQADVSSTRKHGGTGLGLAISSRLVEQMAGRMWVESEVGCGSTFHFTARFGIPAEQPRAHPGAVTILSGVRVLIVDNHATNRIVLEEMLSGWDMRPASAGSAQQALETLRQAFHEGPPFSLVLTDANLPDRDGFALAQDIRRDADVRSTVIMMLSSSDHAGDVERCKQLGLEAYLVKPVKQSELFDAVLTALGAPAVEAELSRPVDHHDWPKLAPLRILLVEDSLVNRKLAVGLLKKFGHAVAVATDGREAVAAYEAAEHDLVLMDVQMPQMDGFEATRAIRLREKATGKHIPIVAMTAHALKGDRQRCLEAGMDGYVAKPIHTRELFEAMAAALASSGRPVAAAARPAVSIPLNEAELLKCLGSPEMVRIVVEGALEECPQRFSAMQEAVARRDAASLRLAAHSFRGAIRYFGDNPAAGLAEKLETMGRCGDLEGAGELVEQLRPAMQGILQRLADYLER